MKLGSAGEAFFVEETTGDVKDELRTSPILSPTDRNANRSSEVGLNSSFTLDEEVKSNSSLIEDDEELDIKLLSEPPNVVYQNYKDKLKQDIAKEEREKEEKKVGKVTNDEPLPSSNWRWLWGKLPEKKSEEEVKGKVKSTEEDKAETVMRSHSLGDIDDIGKVPPQIAICKANDEIERRGVFKSLFGMFRRVQKDAKILETLENKTVIEDAKSPEGGKMAISITTENEPHKIEDQSTAITDQSEGQLGKKVEQPVQKTPSSPSEDKNELEKSHVDVLNQNNEGTSGGSATQIKEVSSLPQIQIQANGSNFHMHTDSSAKMNESTPMNNQKIELEKEECHSVELFALDGTRVRFDDDEVSPIKMNALNPKISGLLQNVIGPSGNNEISPLVNPFEPECEDKNEASENEEETQIELSLCGNLIQEDKIDEIEKVFEDKKVSFEEFSQNPHQILYNPNLLVKIEDKFYNWRAAAPLIVSLLAYRHFLPNEVMDNLVSDSEALNFEEYTIKSKEGSLCSGPLYTSVSKTNESHLKNIGATQNDKKKKNSRQTKKKELDNKNAGNSQKGQSDFEKMILEQYSSDGDQPTAAKINKEEANPVARELGLYNEQNKLYDITKKLEGDKNKTSEKQSSDKKLKTIYKKSLTPSSEQLKTLPLKEGSNDITFTVKSTLQGVQTINANMYLWTTDTKIVVSDVDGTITKSDVLGQVMPMFGKDWSHNGVARLYNNIKSSGYQLLYLTARAIGQAATTRNYLKKLMQNQQLLPDGPIVMSPDGLIPSFKREVIHRKPQLFKIAALRNIRNLFPSDVSPFYAGFGNRDSDVIAYRAVGMELGKIFCINTQGDIGQFNSTYKKSYPLLNEIVNEMFPLAKVNQADEQFNNFNYWKQRIPLLDEQDQDVEITHYF